MSSMSEKTIFLPEHVTEKVLCVLTESTMRGREGPQHQENEMREILIFNDLFAIFSIFFLPLTNDFLVVSKIQLSCMDD